MKGKSVGASAISIWQQHNQNELTEVDAHEISANIVAFFDLLNKWDEAEQSGGLSSTSPSKGSNGGAGGE